MPVVAWGTWDGVVSFSPYGVRYSCVRAERTLRQWATMLCVPRLPLQLDRCVRGVQPECGVLSDSVRLCPATGVGSINQSISVQSVHTWLHMYIHIPDLRVGETCYDSRTFSKCSANRM